MRWGGEVTVSPSQNGLVIAMDLGDSRRAHNPKVESDSCTTLVWVPSTGTEHLKSHVFWGLVGEMGHSTDHVVQIFIAQLCLGPLKLACSLECSGGHGLLREGPSRSMAAANNAEEGQPNLEVRFQGLCRTP